MNFCSPITHQGIIRRDSDSFLKERKGCFSVTASFHSLRK